MKHSLLAAAVIILISTNAIAASSKHAKTNATATSSVVNTSKFSNALALVPADKVNVDVQKVYDETNGVEDEGYDIYMTGKNFKGDVTYGDDGTIIHYYEEIKDTQMPLVVMKAIEAKYPGALFTKDRETINKNGEDIYKAYFTYNNKHGYALVNADGNIIRSRK